MTATDDLTVLGSTVRRTLTAEELETFPAPEGCQEVCFYTEEFTANCPLTSQPDSYAVTIRYVPDARCIESKSLKLYLWSFREQGAFAEALASELADAIHAATGGADTAVRLQQAVRGGIITTVYATRGEGLWSW